MNAARLLTLEVLASVAARQRQPSMSPDGLGDWQVRRHGTAPPNMPRKLTSVTVTLDSERGTYHLSGDNGTSLLNIHPDSGLYKAAAALFAALD